VPDDLNTARGLARALSFVVLLFLLVAAIVWILT
jgi:hypothetical protein